MTNKQKNFSSELKWFSLPKTFDDKTESKTLMKMLVSTVHFMEYCMVLQRQLIDFPVDDFFELEFFESITRETTDYKKMMEVS